MFLPQNLPNADRSAFGKVRYKSIVVLFSDLMKFF